MTFRAASLVALFLLVLLSASTLPASESDERERGEKRARVMEKLDPLLSWLPADMESVWMCPHGYVMPAEGVRRAQQPMSIGPFGGHKYIGGLQGKEVLAYVSGARRFRPPTGLGPFRYEACQIFQLETEADPSADAYIKEILKTANETKTVDGHPVAVFHSQAEQDLWKFYVVQPRNDIFVITAGLKPLEDMLHRFKQGSAKRALPPELLEWDLIDPDASSFVIRHFDRENWEEEVDGQVTGDPTSPYSNSERTFYDPDAIGFVFSVPPPGEKVAKVYYLSKNARVKTVAARSWKQEYLGSLYFEVREREPGVIELSHPYESDDEISTLMMALLTHLGFGVLV